MKLRLVSFCTKNEDGFVDASLCINKSNSKAHLLGVLQAVMSEILLTQIVLEMLHPQVMLS